MKFTLSFEEYLKESNISNDTEGYWFVVSEDQIVGVYDNPKKAKSNYEKEIDLKKDLYFDKFIQDLENSGQKIWDYEYSHTSPSELVLTDEEYDEYFEDNYGHEIFITGPHKLAELPDDISPLMNITILNDIKEYGYYEL
jgi:hypothetical protein